MAIKTETIGSEGLAEYSRLPIAFEVRSVFDVEEAQGGLGGLGLSEREVAPYQKDYDAYDDGGPLRWASRFDTTNWAFWLARDGDVLVGAAAVAWNTPGVDMLEGRSDLAVLWDIRVLPAARRGGVGTALFTEAATWAKSKGCSRLKIETQNVNVGACRFYARMGCFLGRIDRLAYQDCPAVAHEAMLVWYLDLCGRGTPRVSGMERYH